MNTTQATNTEGLDYPYLLNGETAHLHFEESSPGMIDPQRYSLLEVLHDKRLDHLSFKQRHEIMNSFIAGTKAVQHYTYRRELLSPCDAEVIVKCNENSGMRRMINLASNDYLNLSIHPQLKKAAADAVNRFGFGSGSAAMLAGTHSLHKKLEDKIAALYNRESAMLFTSGYGANTGVLRALLRETDVAICDRYAHASLMDGCTHTNQLFFAHNDMGSLKRALEKAASYNNKIVVIDGVYSMEGDIARLDEILQLAHAYGAWVLCDEAHATGVIGPNGEGTEAYFGLEGKADIITGTFSKALGGVGGFVAGSNELINYLQIATRSYMFSTSLPIPAAAAMLEALDIIAIDPGLMQALWNNIRYFRNALQAMGFDTGLSETAIIPVIIGNDTLVKEMTRRLHRAGILVNAVPYPAVPKKLTRIRISLSANHTQAQMDYALEQIEKVGRELGVISAC
ncbi:aminotransferase class I/II-fold pyridoxal phosphate-dependent enzyme [Pseudoflavitalea sp. X16]|uniref:aminotransferase class I/II-fold pyridoxal phosphate-dependent enzyme n=1 Tax=Paraflavitalea devenefica TaxID=2716334 RepID=UPI001421A184|nr:aminotransferase class I/II-fold pyridoxal phosphate-dependent enzyme [Paraflavitalea devenefica]NII27426.1 aminotransferase class I/II-fold pyridoxal phosphate-dependent enzyme [Paraflavitalea devenefica]